MSLVSLTEEFTLCVRRENSIHLVDLLKKLATSPSLIQASEERLESTNYEAKGALLPSMAVDDLWKDFLSSYICSMVRKAQGALEAAYGDILLSIQNLHRIFMNSTRWILPVVYYVNDLFWDMARSLGSLQSEEAARLINKTLTICMTDRGPLTTSRKWGFYRLAALLFRVYFHLDQLNLCGNVLRAMGAADLPDPLRYPSAHLVTFRYWLGRFYFVSGEYTKAEVEMSLAWAHCPAEADHNKRLILYFLLPLRLMMAATYPSRELLKRYRLHDSPYPTAIGLLRAGRVVEYQNLLQRLEPDLLRLGTFPIWEKLVLVAHRNLLKRIFRLMGSCSRIQVASLVAAFAMMGERRDADELSCLLAILIDRGLIKGYISQEKATLVLSLKDPFPSLDTAQISK